MSGMPLGTRCPYLRSQGKVSGWRGPITEDPKLALPTHQAAATPPRAGIWAEPGWADAGVHKAPTAGKHCSAQPRQRQHE